MGIEPKKIGNVVALLRFARYRNLGVVDVSVDTSFHAGMGCCEPNVSQVTEDGMASGGRRFAQRAA